MSQKNRILNMNTTIWSNYWNSIQIPNYLSHPGSSLMSSKKLTTIKVGPPRSFIYYCMIFHQSRKRQNLRIFLLLLFEGNISVNLSYFSWLYLCTSGSNLCPFPYAIIPIPLAHPFCLIQGGVCLYWTILCALMKIYVLILVSLIHYLL